MGLLLLWRVTAGSRTAWFCSVVLTAPGALLFGYVALAAALPGASFAPARTPGCSSPRTRSGLPRCSPPRCAIGSVASPGQRCLSAGDPSASRVERYARPGVTGSPPDRALAKAASSTAATSRDCSSGSTHPGPPVSADDTSSTITW